MMSLGLRNGSTPSSFDHQAGDPAMDAVARFLQDTSRMLDWLLSTHLPDHFDVRTSLSIGMPSAPHSILPHLLQDAYCHGFPDGRMAPLQAFQYPSYRPGVTYHGDPHLGLQQWYNQRPSGSSVEGVRHPDIAQFRNGMCSSLGKQPERGNQPAALVNRDALKRFVEEMKRTVQEWFAKHSLLAEGKILSFDPPVRLTKVPDAAHPFQNSSHARVHAAGPSFLFSRPAEVGPVSQGLAGNGPGPNEVTRTSKGFSQQETKTPEKARALQGQCTVPKNSIDGSLDKVVEDMACQLFGNDVDQETFTDAEKHPEKVGLNAGTKPSAAQAEQCEDSLAIDEEPHVIFTTPTAKEITGTQASDFATPVRDGEKLKVALVATTSSTPAPRRKRLAVRTQMPRRPVEMVSSPDWLPPGWVTEVKIRGSGNSAGSKDKYYVDPVTKRRFRSRKEVYAFLEFGTLDRTRKTEEIPVRKLLGPPDVGPAIPDTGPGAAPVAPNEGPRAPPVAPNDEPAIRDGQAEVGPAARPAIGPVLEPDLPAAPLEMEKSAKKKRGRPPGSRSKRQNAPPSTSAPPTILPSTIAAPSGVMGNMFMPYRTGQPSDWLVYESVATLPFPMFDPFYFSDYNVNKANGNKGPPGRPWFFTGPEASWRPSMGTPPYGATSQSPGSSPREPSNGRKRPLKKSPDRATPAPANV